MIAVLVFILSIFWYINKKYSLFIWGLTLLLTNIYYFVPSDSIFDYLSTALILVSCALEIISGNHKFFSYKNDKIAKIILLLLLLFSLNCIITIIIKRETTVSALKVLYNNLFIIAYFIFRKFELKHWDNSLKYILPCSIIGGIFYYLQFLGIHVLSGIISENEFGQVAHRYMNYPAFTYLFLFYFLFAKVQYKYILLLFFIPFIILPMSRGAMLSFVITIFIFLYLKGKLTKSIIKIAIPIMLTILIFYPMIKERFVGKNNKVSFGDEITNILSWKSYSDYDTSNSDTYAFRIAIIWERLDYMLDHPQTILLGNGSVYEHTKACTSLFNFYIGSASLDKDGELFVRQIETTDIVFITHFFRYGIFYIIFIIQYLKLCFRRFNKTQNIWADVALLFLLFSIIRCTASSPFYDFGIQRMFPLLLFSGILYHPLIKKNNEKIICCHSHL